MEFRGSVAVVKRKAVFMFADNLSVVCDATIPCDAGNHFSPQWPKTLSLNGRQFEFYRDAHEPQKRPMYKEVPIPETSIVDSKELNTEDLRSMIKFQNEIIKSMAEIILVSHPHLINIETVIANVMAEVESNEG